MLSRDAGRSDRERRIREIIARHPVGTQEELAVTLRRTGASHLERLRANVDPAVPMLYVPYQFARFHGVRATNQVSAALSAELGY